MKEINIPERVNKIIKKLETNGFSAYAVGGCVRDSVMHIIPKDWDIATSALPCNVKQIFSHTVDTGLAHGTVTVIEGGEKYEVTTFRRDGDYSDGRRPDSVSFINDINEDLSRRDFTVNAMAYNIRTGITDPFGGLEDIKRGIIRTVGKAEERFAEDALRILRAVRFSAVLGFEIEEKTQKACADCAGKLAVISGERAFSELDKIFANASEYHYNILKSAGIFAAVLPEAKKTDFSLVSEYMLKSDTSAVRWVLACGEGAPKALLRLKVSRALLGASAELVRFIDADISDVKSCASGLKFASFKEVCDLKGDGDAYERYLKAVEEHEPIYMADLNISSDALMNAGFKGRAIGEIKKKLLKHVWEYPADNDGEKLIELAIKMRGEVI